MSSAVKEIDMEEANPKQAPSGGAFACNDDSGAQIFSPEDFTEEHRRFFETAAEFSAQDIEPRAESLDHKKPGLIQELMAKAAELGFFMVDIPEDYDGLALDKTTSMLVAEATAKVGSFAVTFGAHTGIGTLPLVYYGTDEQKRRYLPKLASGELLAAYCLSEASSGSDALAAKTTARLDEDGKHYVLNGTKAWITNGGFADLFTVFAQVVDPKDAAAKPKFTAFLVERGYPGVSIGKEERKLGIRGSSTTLVILDDVKVPVENLLGEIGRGHKIAFNILNIGRWKLGIGATGAAKYALSQGARYAKERRQFREAIGNFGLIREKLAYAASLIYASESMAYRTAGLIDSATAALGDAGKKGAEAIKVIEEYTIEASILKVFGSETLSWIADEMLQVHAGNGFTEDYAIERCFRDARINRIFEGTNEINRLIIPATLFKRTLQGRLPLMQFAQQVVADISNPDNLPQAGEGPLADELRAVALARRAIVFAASYAAQKYLADLKDKQRVLGAIADSLIALFAMDSAVARAQKAQSHPGVDEREKAFHTALAKLYCFEARVKVFQNLRRVAMFMAKGKELDTLYDNLGALDQRYRVDIIALQEAIAQATLDAEGYPLTY